MTEYVYRTINGKPHRRRTDQTDHEFTPVPAGDTGGGAKTTAQIGRGTGQGGEGGLKVGAGADDLEDKPGDNAITLASKKYRRQQRDKKAAGGQ